MKIAVLLPTHFDVGILLRAKELIRVLARAYMLSDGVVEIALGLPERPEGLWRKHEDFLKADSPCSVIVRKLRWEGFPAENIRRMFMLQQLQVDLRGFETVQVPRDWGWNFVDCDLWFNFADPAQGAILPLKPIANYVTDLAVRVVPDAYSVGLSDPYWFRQLDAFRMWRRTGIVLCSDESTVTDVVGYAGVKSENVMLVDSLAACDSALPFANASSGGKQLVWLVEPNERHANLAALEALTLYLQEGGLLKPVIASQEALAFQKPDTVKSMAGIDPRGVELLQSMELYSYRDYPRLARLLQRSGGLWSSEVAGGEGLAAMLAKRHGLWFLGQRFAENERATAFWSENRVLYTSPDPVAIADGLHQMEEAMKGALATTRPEARSDALKLQQFGFVIDRLQEFASA